MGKSTKPRKAYKPTAKTMPIVFGMKQDEKIELAIAPLMAINMFTSGNGNEELAYTMINSILLSYRLVNDGKEFQTLIDGADAMRRVVARGAHGKWGFSGDDLREVTAAVTLSDQLQANATRRQMRAAVLSVLENAE
jgi:hypothetical protein